MKSLLFPFFCQHHSLLFCVVLASFYSHATLTNFDWPAGPQDIAQSMWFKLTQHHDWDSRLVTSQMDIKTTFFQIALERSFSRRLRAQSLRGRLASSIDNTIFEVNSATIVPVGYWIHVVLTFSSSQQTVNLYHDGVRTTEQSFADLTTVALSPSRKTEKKKKKSLIF